MSLWLKGLLEKQNSLEEITQAKPFWEWYYSIDLYY